MPKILLGNNYDDASWAILTECVPEEYEVSQLEEVSQVALAAAIEDADYLIASGRLHIDANVINCAKRLKLIARTGVGLDSIDLDALRVAGVKLVVNSGVNADSVAEHTLLLILAALRMLPEANERVKAGCWPKREIGLQTHELAGKSVYIVGQGSIGSRVAELLAPFGCDVFGTNRAVKGSLPLEFFEADIVTLHCPLTQETRHLIDADAIARMKFGSILINTARGGLIDEYALAEGLRVGRPGYACLDVRDVEPSFDISPFDEVDNIILTPHMAGITYESFKSMISGAISNIVEFDRGLCLTEIDKTLGKDL